MKRKAEVFEAEREAPTLRKPGSATVEIIVGKDEDTESFAVHKDFLTYWSPYFESALSESSNFIESEGVVKLDHTSPEVFGLFLECLYTQRIEDRIEDPCSVELESESEDRPTMSQLVSLWILADYLQVPMIQNEAMDLIISKDCRSQHYGTDFLTVCCVEDVYNQTLPGSPLRKVFADMFQWNLKNKEWFKSDVAEKFPKEFLLDLVYGYAEEAQENALYTRQTGPLKKPMKYHVKCDKCD